MLGIRPIGRGSLVDAVVERIRATIVQGQLKPGNRLPTEGELARELGVSRNVLREAVGQLQSMGLLLVQRGRGMFVGNRDSVFLCARTLRNAMAISPQDIIQFTEFRKAIECYSAKRAAEIATDEEIMELERACLVIDEEGIERAEAMRRDFHFHCRLMSLTGNKLMSNLLEAVQEFILAGMLKITPQQRDREVSRPMHMRIVEAIRAHDHAAAERAMAANMDFGIKRLREYIAQSKSM